MNFVAVTTRILIGVLFISSGLVKLRHKKEFSVALQGYKLIPGGLASSLSSAVPILELLLGFGLLIPRYSRLATLGIESMLLLFVVIILGNTLRADNTQGDCGCGLLHARVGWPLLLRNILLFAMLAFVQLTG